MEKKMILRDGTRVNYYQNFTLVGTGKIVGSDTKNGQRVYDVDLDNGKQHWGYRDQFELAQKS